MLRANLKVFFLLAMLNLADQPVWAQSARTVKNWHTPEEFGAAGDGKSDDSNALIKALNSGFAITFHPGSTYLISQTIRVRHISAKTIDMNGATIRRPSGMIGLTFENCSSIVLRSGNIVCQNLVSERSGFENCINYAQCRDVTTSGMHIDGSGEMGIVYINCIGVTVSNDTVKNCYRDGIHLVYCANVRIFNNYLENITDDAIACHDYGTDAQKGFLRAHGFSQASNINIYSNTISNVFQGISSIACKNISITRNHISGTIAAGIAVFNTRALNPGGTASVQMATITGNEINDCGIAQFILGKSYMNNSQNSTGRAAIFVGTLGPESRLDSIRRLSQVSVMDNKVSNAGVNGLWFCDIDNGNLAGNTFTNCCIEHSSFSGTVCVIYRVTGAKLSNNQTIDNRFSKMHYYGFDVRKVSGNVTGLNNKGCLAGNHVLEVHPSYR
jgi:parallel beta-helix repeat protein